MSGYAENRSKATTDNIHAVANQLRELAEKVDRYAEIERNIRTMELDHARAARDVIHTVMWGVANLHLDSVVALAAEADRAARDDE